MFWENRYLSFLEELLVIDESTFKELVFPFLDKISEKSLERLLSSLVRLKEILNENKDFLREFNVVSLLIKSITNSKTIIDVYLIDEKIKKLELSSDMQKVVCKSIMLYLEKMESENLIEFLSRLRWGEWREESIIKQTISRISPEILTRALTDEIPPLSFGTALVGLTKILNSIALETLNTMGITNIIKVIERSTSFEDIRFWVYGIDAADETLLDTVKDSIKPSLILPLIKKEDLSFLAWFYIEYQNKLPKVANELLIQSIRKFLVKQPSPNELGSIFDLLWKNEVLPKEIFSEFNTNQFLPMLEEWLNFDFLIALLIKLDDALLLEGVDKLPLAQKLYFMKLLLDVDHTRYEKLISNLFLPLEASDWEKQIRVNEHQDLMWISKTHPRVYALIKSQIVMKKFQEIITSGILYKIREKTGKFLRKS
ncbi:hypothetical protein CEE45_08600 [Candidatus Heimdallarchaeota archaeon B3_Heim]|nr:MAG: hypothetical protein CEE45_08600 [Candidatus Heimdallarchaeota archaeon B3_Heim]